MEKYNKIKDLNLIDAKIPIRFCEYKISNRIKDLMPTESKSVSNQGIVFSSDKLITEDTLLRIWVELPDYWDRKSKHVKYNYSEFPTYFQILSRILKCEEFGGQQPQYSITCETVNIDKIDGIILNDYLNSAES